MSIKPKSKVGGARPITGPNDGRGKGASKLHDKLSELVKKGKLMQELEDAEGFHSDIIVDFEEEDPKGEERHTEEIKHPVSKPIGGKAKVKHPPRHVSDSEEDEDDDGEDDDEGTKRRQATSEEDETDLTTDMSDLTTDLSMDDTETDTSSPAAWRPLGSSSLSAKKKSKPKIEKLKKEQKKQKRTINKLVKITKKAREELSQQRKEKAKGGNPQPKPEVSHQINRLQGILRM